MSRKQMRDMDAVTRVEADALVALATTENRLARGKPYRCKLCGQRITDGNPCGCGARPAFTTLQTPIANLIDAAEQLLYWYGGLAEPERVPNRNTLTRKIRALRLAVNNAKSTTRGERR